MNTLILQESDAVAAREGVTNYGFLGAGVAVCYTVLQCVAGCCWVCCSKLQCVLQHVVVLWLRHTKYGVLGVGVEVCCSVLQGVLQ